MIKNLTILILCLASFTATAQYDGKGENEVSRFRPGFIWYFTGLKPAKVEKVRNNCVKDKCKKGVVVEEAQEASSCCVAGFRSFRKNELKL